MAADIGGGAAGRMPSCGELDDWNLGIRCGEFCAELAAEDGFWGSGGGGFCSGGGGGLCGSSAIEERLTLCRLGGISGGILCGSWVEPRAGTSGGGPEIEVLRSIC